MIFPWPDAQLCGNRRSDRRKITAIRAAARDTGWALASEARLKFKSIPLRLTMTFIQPNHLKRDILNVAEGMKYSIDGIFNALGLDDCLIAEVHLRWGGYMRGGAVQVELTQIDAVSHE
jgi:hypothetical protein